MAAAEIDNVVTTKLLTLLNASVTKVRKRKRDFDDSLTLPPVKKLGGKRVVVPNVEENPKESERELIEARKESVMVDLNDEKEAEIPDDPFNAHFGASSRHLADPARRNIEERQWKTSSRSYGRLGSAVLQVPESVSEDTLKAKVTVVDKLEKQVSAWKSSKGHAIQHDLLTTLSFYQDLYWSKMDLKSRQPSREAITLHCLNHILKIRRRVLKNNERLSNAREPSAPQPEPTTLLDQGFTRPSVLILLPFRSFAHAWISALLERLPSHQVENRSRFNTEFTLPAGATDKLLIASHGAYPNDHVENFKGNIDDSFRVGIKVTRKSIKLFSDFYSSDIIVSSPLGLRQIIEKEKHGDFLSSIEILVVDQLDVLTMQNWSHLQLVFSHLNLLPKESHDSDFSRIKPWYLDGHASYLRQSILLSSYETPEIRSLFNKELRNVAGRIRTEAVWSPVQVPEGVQQNFMKFEGLSAKDEINKRFEFFTTHIFPELLKSAMQSANTIIFVPSYFDYCRVRNWLKARGDVTFAVLSEDSDNKGISRARQAFFTGTKQFLLVTERFHFFRRYKIRGVRNIIFYAPPEHTEFYTEFLSFPFLDEGVVAEDVTAKMVYSKYDYMRLERIVGSKNISDLVGM